MMSGVTVKNNESGFKTTIGAMKEGEKITGKKSIRSSKFIVSKDEKTGSYCMDPVAKDTLK